MEQMSFFEENKIAFPMTHDDVLKLHKQYIFEDEKDKDAFEWKEIKNGYSYYFYGTKVMEHTVLPSGKVKFSINRNLGMKMVNRVIKTKGSLLLFLTMPTFCTTWNC